MAMSPDQVALGVLQFVGLFIPIVLITLRVFLDSVSADPHEPYFFEKVAAEPAIRLSMYSVGLSFVAMVLAGWELLDGLESIYAAGAIVFVLLAVVPVIWMLVKLWKEYDIDIFRSPPPEADREAEESASDE